MNKRETFEHRQNTAKRKAEGLSEFITDMAVKYGAPGRQHYWSSREVKLYEKLKKAQSRAEASFFKHLKTVQTRDFSVGVPVWWLRDKLTFEDATTTDAMSVIPPPAYGYTDHDARQKAQAVR